MVKSIKGSWGSIASVKSNSSSILVATSLGQVIFWEKGKLLSTKQFPEVLSQPLLAIPSPVRERSKGSIATLSEFISPSSWAGVGILGGENTQNNNNNNTGGVAFTPQIGGGGGGGEGSGGAGVGGSGVASGGDNVNGSKSVLLRGKRIVAHNGPINSMQVTDTMALTAGADAIVKLW